MFDVLQHKTTTLDTQIEYFRHQIANRVKKDSRLQQIEYHQAIYDIFENVTRDLIKLEPPERGYIEWITDTLNLREGLPERAAE
jgi:hypothetical protein